jgi:phosphatidylinositol glycan class T
LVKQVNGIFCSSILEMDPLFTSRPYIYGVDTKLYRYGHLSGEPLCTENIKPFLRLLPCKTTGLARLIDLKDVFASSFHTLSISAKNIYKRDAYHWRVELLAHFVKSHVRMLEKNINSPFRFPLNSDLKCKIADRQIIMYDLPPSYTANLPENSSKPFDSIDISTTDFSKNEIFMIRLNHTISQSLSYEHTPMFLLNIAHEKPDARGGILTSKIVNNLEMGYLVNYYHMIPWQLHIDISSLDFSCVYEGEKTEGEIVEKSLVPSLIRRRPSTISLQIVLPPYSTCTLKLSFTNHLMTALAYPPDSNYGISVPGPMLVFRQREDVYRKFSNIYGSFIYTEEDSRTDPHTHRAVTIFGEPLLILLPTPDFSMPFNVICIVTTATGFLFGSTFNLAVKLFIPVITSTSSKAPMGWRAKLASKIPFLRN